MDITTSSTIYIDNIEDKNKYSMEKTIVCAKSNGLTEEEIDLLSLSLKNAYESSVYIEKIKKDLIDIFGDFMISINDIPAIIHLILDSIDLLKSVINIGKPISKKIMKYVIFGILYRIIIDDGKITHTEQAILKNYEFIWNIITFSSSSLEIKKSTECSCFWF